MILIEHGGADKGFSIINEENIITVYSNKYGSDLNGQIFNVKISFINKIDAFSFYIYGDENYSKFKTQMEELCLQNKVKGKDKSRLLRIEDNEMKGEQI